MEGMVSTLRIDELNAKADDYFIFIWPHTRAKTRTYKFLIFKLLVVRHCSAYGFDRQIYNRTERFAEFFSGMFRTLVYPTYCRISVNRDHSQE